MKHPLNILLSMPSLVFFLFIEIIEIIERVQESVHESVVQIEI